MSELLKNEAPWAYLPAMLRLPDKLMQVMQPDSVAGGRPWYLQILRRNLELKQ